MQKIKIAIIRGVTNKFISRQKTNDNGTAVFTLQVNGNYTLKVSAAGFISDDFDLNHNCDYFRCRDCNPTLNPQIKKSFCENKTFEMVVTNAVNNERISFADLTVWMDVNVSLVLNQQSLLIIGILLNHCRLKKS